MKDLLENYFEYLPHPDEPLMIVNQSLGTRFKEYIQRKTHFSGGFSNRPKHP